MLGTLVIAMSLQLDRRGVWNMMAPCVFALTVMASIWVCHHCLLDFLPEIPYD